MDYRYFVDCVKMPCCVMSVEKTAAGACGEIRIVCANRAYRETMGPAYHDGMIYSELVPKDNKFEDFCYHAAILGQRMHAYVETKALGFWTDQTLIPLVSEREDAGYCQFIFEFTKGADADRMAAVSVNNAEPVIRACIRLVGTGDFHAGVSEALDVILHEAAAGTARILLLDHEEKRVLHYCDRTPDERIRRRADDPLPYELVRSWERTIGVSNAVIIKNGADMAALESENPVWVRSMRENGIVSLALVPLRREDSVIGYLYVANFDVRRVAKVKELLEIMAFFLGAEIHNNLLLSRLERYSMSDELTGVRNRRAMAQRIAAMESSGAEACFGVVSIDLNGLKTVNDREGHEAGDRLLTLAGELLKERFRRDDIFRTGGDEFIVLLSGAERETLERNVERLREDAAHRGVAFAIGSAWSDGSVPFRDAYRRADEMMYADKDAFYRAHPGLHRR